MKLTKRKLRILIESYLSEGDVLQFPTGGASGRTLYIDHTSNPIGFGMIQSPGEEDIVVQHPGVGRKTNRPVAKYEHDPNEDPAGWSEGYRKLFNWLRQPKYNVQKVIDRELQQERPADDRVYNKYTIDEYLTKLVGAEGDINASGDWEMDYEEQSYDEREAPVAPDREGLFRLAVSRGTMIKDEETGEYVVNPDLDWSDTPYNILMGTIGDHDLIGDMEDYGPYQFQINITKARGPVDSAELSGIWFNSEDVKKAINALIYGGGLLGDLIFRSINPKYNVNMGDAWRPIRSHIGFDEDPDAEREFYKEFGDHYPEDVLDRL